MHGFQLPGLQSAPSVDLPGNSVCFFCLFGSTFSVYNPVGNPFQVPAAAAYFYSQPANKLVSGEFTAVCARYPDEHILVLILIALARPQRYQERIEQTSEGIDIMLVMDVSESMLLEDFKPTRLEAAKQVAHTFINGRFQDRMGIVVFAGNAFGLVPLTTDYRLLHQYIDEIRSKMISSSGTAIVMLWLLPLTGCVNQILSRK
jgi:hypothetical protein